VRGLVLFCLAIVLLPAARAQDQERKLVDRLLKPDTTLQNNAQNKKFIADGAPVDKRATISAFYIQQRSKPASFARTSEFSTADFNSRSYHNANRTSVSAQKQAQDSSESYSTSSVRKLPNASDSHKGKVSRTYAGQRPFLERGKSQKSLERHNPPLTIEQVRELLNKNK
jgi:hypothetical protein